MMADAFKPCAVDDCNNPVVAKGFCNGHYRRMRKGVDPHADHKPLQTYGASCSVCGAKAYGNGLCSKHYTRMRNTGTTNLKGTPPGSVKRWIEDHLAYQGDDCLIWPFSRSRVTGFGTLTINRRSMRAHRVMCEKAHGKPPSQAHHAAHSCGKGHLGCVNPRHLRWATAKENAADKIAHGTAPRGARQGQSKLTEADIRGIRGMLASGRPPKEVADRFSISVGTVRAIKGRRRWGWLE